MAAAVFQLSLDVEQLSIDGVQEQPQDIRDEVLNDALLPSAIVALPHVLDRIEELLKSPQQSLLEAVTTGQVQWIRRLLERFECDLLEATTLAAVHGHVETVKLLLPAITPEREQQKMTWKVIDTAAMHGHLDVIDFAWKHLNAVGYGDWFA